MTTGNDDDINHITSSIVNRWHHDGIDIMMHLMVIHIDGSHDGKQHHVVDDMTS